MHVLQDSTVVHMPSIATLSLSCGYHAELLLSSHTAGGWSFFCNVDKEDKGDNTPVATSGVGAARELFRNKTVRGQDIKNDTDTLKTLHERPITLLQDASLPGTGSNAGRGISRISTSSLDGKLVIWDLPSLDISMASLGV